MSIQLLNDISTAFNRCWPQHYTSMMRTRVGMVGDGDKVKELNVNAILHVRPIQNVNQNYIRTVVVSVGKFPDFTADTFDVYILTHAGKITINSLHDRELADKYLKDRIIELNASANHLDMIDGRFPIKWEDQTQRDIHRYEYTLIGTTTIPMSILDLGIDDICKLLVGGLTLVEHPNYMDSYLDLNNRGLISDTWTNPEKK
jgi:hypothetical protein